MIFMTRSVTAWARGREGEKIQNLVFYKKLVISSPFPSQPRVHADGERQWFLCCCGFLVHEGEI